MPVDNDSEKDDVPLIDEVLSDVEELNEATEAVRKILRKNQAFKKILMAAISTAGDVLSTGGVPFAGTAADLVVFGIAELTKK